MKRILTKVLPLLVLAGICMSCNENKPAERSALETIMNRRSVRQFTPEKLTDQQIETLLRAGMAAPTGMNVQPWQFVVVTDTAVISALRTYPAPCLIVVCGETSFERRPRDGGEPVKTENGNWTADCAAATENILLAAEAIGLGAVWTACYPYPDRLEPTIRTLGIPEGFMPYNIIVIGHPADNPAPKDKWKPEKIHYNKW